MCSPCYILRRAIGLLVIVEFSDGLVENYLSTKDSLGESKDNTVIAILM